MNAVLPAKSERTQYGEPEAPVGPSGSTCQTVKPALASPSMKARTPLTSEASSELKWSRTPQRLRSNTLSSSPGTADSSARAAHGSTMLRRTVPDRYRSIELLRGCDLQDPIQ